MIPEPELGAALSSYSRDHRATPSPKDAERAFVASLDATHDVLITAT